MSQRRIYFGIGCFLLTLSIVSLLPLLGLYLEFRGIEFRGQSYWTYIARLYGSYFLFPLFGFVAGLMLIVPLGVLWLVLRDPSYRHLLVYALVGWCALVAIASVLEFSASPHALFEVAPQALSQGDGKTFFDRLRTACHSDTFVYKNKFDGGDGTYQGDLEKAKAVGKSYSAYLYYLAVPFQAAFLLLFLVMFFLMVYFRKPFISEFLARERLIWEQQNIFLLFGVALVIAGVWCLYRAAYRTDHIQLFGGSTGFSADLVVFWLYFSVIVIYITFAGLDLEQVAKTGAQVASAATLLGMSVVPSKYSAQFFGLDASVQNVFALVVLFSLLIAIGMIFNTAPPKLAAAEPDDG